MFVIWGALHGLAVVIHRLWSRVGLVIYKWPAIVLTFLFVNVAWVFFRATHWTDAYKVLNAMFFQLSFPDIWNPTLVKVGNPVGPLLFSLAVCFFAPNSMELKDRFKSNLLTLLFAWVVFIASILRMESISEFLYFNF